MPSFSPVHSSYTLTPYPLHSAFPSLSRVPQKTSPSTSSPPSRQRIQEGIQNQHDSVANTRPPLALVAAAAAVTVTAAAATARVVRVVRVARSRAVVVGVRAVRAVRVVGVARRRRCGLRGWRRAERLRVLLRGAGNVGGLGGWWWEEVGLLVLLLRW